jgi:hypothetical protein
MTEWKLLVPYISHVQFADHFRCRVGATVPPRTREGRGAQTDKGGVACSLANNVLSCRLPCFRLWVSGVESYIAFRENRGISLDRRQMASTWGISHDNQNNRYLCQEKKGCT